MSVHVIATGGTISSHFDGTAWTNLGGPSLVAELGDLPVTVTVEDVASGPSSHLSVDDMCAIARGVTAALERGADGVVVVHGTDTMELTAFVSQLHLGTSPDRRPVVFTGAMRVHSHPAPDGPVNLRSAITAAATRELVGMDVLVCMDGQLHAAPRVSKVHAASLDAFTSHPFAPVGTVDDSGISVLERCAPRRSAPVLRGPVPLFTCYPGVEAPALEPLLADAPAVVVEAFGDLNLPRSMWAPLHHAAQRGTLVVVASRPFTPTVTNEGLDALGAVGAGGLSPQKARLAAMAALGSCRDRHEVIEFIHQYALRLDAQNRSTAP